MLLSKATYNAFRLYIVLSVCVPWELNPKHFALLTQCSTTEPQEQVKLKEKSRHEAHLSDKQDMVLKQKYIEAWCLLNTWTWHAFVLM